MTLTRYPAEQAKHKTGISIKQFILNRSGMPFYRKIPLVSTGIDLINY